MISLVGTFIIIWKMMYEEVSYFRQGNYVVVLVYTIILLAFSTAYSGLKIGELRLREIIYSNGLAVVITNIITYFQFSLIKFRLLSVTGMVTLSTLQILVAIILCFICNKIYLYVNPATKVLVICSQKADCVDMLEKMNILKEKYEVKEVVLAHENLKEIEAKIQIYEGVMIYDIDAELKEYILSYSYRYDKQVYIIPTISEIIINKAQHTTILDTSVLLCKNSGLSIEQRILKRLLDIIISFIGLICTSPLMVATAISIKLCDKGPILFKQERLTQDGKHFMLYKFRSMCVDAEKDGVALLAQKDDHRITPVGRIIRKTRLDELPQLFNVLLGQMSIVGPRPERPELAAKYSEETPEFNYRLKVKAGLTGYAQVKGHYTTSPEDKLHLDLMYIENYSLGLDILIMMMTLKIMLMPQRAEGFEKHYTEHKLGESQNLNM